jgi:hypothetical protein
VPPERDAITDAPSFCATSSIHSGPFDARPAAYGGGGHDAAFRLQALPVSSRLEPNATVVLNNAGAAGATA